MNVCVILIIFYDWVSNLNAFFLVIKDKVITQHIIFTTLTFTQITMLIFQTQLRLVSFNTHFHDTNSNDSFEHNFQSSSFL